MAQYHACVWIDHREAKIFTIEATTSEELVVRDHNAPKHIHRKADHVGLGKAKPDEAFFAEVGGDLKQFKAVLIVGPGTARTELAGYLAEYAPTIAKRVWGIEPMDHPTEGEIVAAARKYFHAADRMHA
jgi:stalled ribosome rescue protein Dom34